MFIVIGETEAYISTASKEAIKEYFVLSVDVPFEEECTHALAREEWEKYLSRIEIEDPNKTKNIVSYFDIMNGGDLNDIAIK